MSDGTNLQDTIETVVKRADLLDYLSRGPTGKRDLRDELGVSRSTVYKAVGELEEETLVQADGGTVRLTLSGQLLLGHYQSFVETAEEICQQQTLLSALPSDAPVTADLLTGADYVRAEPHVPSKPLEYVEDLVLSADEIFGLAPVSFRRYVDVFYDRLTSGELAVETVIERPVVEHVREEYDSRFAETITLDHYTIWTTDESLPFGFLLTEGDRAEVAVVVYDDGKPLGVITNDAPAALDWGRDVFERYRDGATEVVGDGP